MAQEEKTIKWNWRTWIFIVIGLCLYKVIESFAYVLIWGPSDVRNYVAANETWIFLGIVYTLFCISGIHYLVSRYKFKGKIKIVKRS